jgi:hypothetical protein
VREPVVLSLHEPIREEQSLLFRLFTLTRQGSDSTAADEPPPAREHPHNRELCPTHELPTGEKAAALTGTQSRKRMRAAGLSPVSRVHFHLTD